MMDTHSYIEREVDGEIETFYDHLWDNQQEWYKWAVNGIKELNGGEVVESTVIFHIPVREYIDAWEAVSVNKTEENPHGEGDTKNELYLFGSRTEDNCPSPDNNGFFALCKELGSTKNIIVGNDHVNDYSVMYEGIRLSYSLKSGFGSYWTPEMIGGTTLNINSKGDVDIENHYSNNGITSFLIEADIRAQEEHPGMEDLCYIKTNYYTFSFKYPDNDDYLEALEQNNQVYINEYLNNISWLKDFLLTVEKAITSKEYYEFSEYIDVESFVDYYLVQEFFKNVDVGSTSQFYTIDQTDEVVKLKAGPVWDFDISCGIVDSSRGYYHSYEYNDLWMRERDYFCKALFNDPLFHEKVSERYAEIREDVVLSIFDEMELVLNILENAQQRNIQRWPLTKERKTWVEEYALSNSYLDINSLEDHYSLVEETLSERLAILDKEYLR
jgi:hypothetical protein